MVRIDRLHRSDDPLVEGRDPLAGGVGRLIHQVVAAHPRVVLVTVGDRLPDVHRAVLEVGVIPKPVDVGAVVGVPVLVLVAGVGVQVDHRVDAVCCAEFDRTIDVPEAVLDDLERTGVALKMVVVDIDAH